jgi:hypothetical protein
VENREHSDYFGYTEQGDIALSACSYCINKNQDTTCKAFPDGIPDDILMRKNDHLEPIEGDHGIQFESRENLGDLPERLKR